MADNVAITAGAGTSIATQDEGGVHYQEVKLVASGSGTTAALTKAEDAAHVSGDHGVPALVVRADTAASLAGTDGDYTIPTVDASGRLWVNASGAAVPVTDNSSSLTVDNTVLSVVGGGVEATAQRVTIASDSTGVLSVDDNGGSLTIDGSLTAVTTVTTVSAVTEITNALPAGTNAIGKLAANSGVDIGDVDVLSVIAGTGATSLGKAEDAVAASGDTGVMVLAVRRDSAASGVSADGDYAALSVDSTGALRVIGSAGGTSATDDAAFTPASGAGTPIMGFADETTPDAVDEGDVGVVRMTLQRGLHVNLRNSSGTELTPSQDATHDSAALTAGPQLMAEFDDTTPDSVDEGDAGKLRISANRNLYTTLRDAAGNERGANVNASNELTVSAAVTSVVPGTGATALGKAIDAAAGATDTGVAPLAIRDDALSALTPVEGDWTPLRVNSTGALYVTGGGGGTQYAVDDIASATATGTAALAVRDDALATLTEADGDESRLRVDSTGRLWVNVSNTVTVASHAVTNAGTFAVQVDGNALTALQLIDDPVFADDAAFTIGTSKVMVAGFTADETATDSLDEGDAGAGRITLDRKLITTPYPHTAGGLSIARDIDLDEGTLTVVKASPGQVYGMWVTNTATATRWIKFYDATSGTAGTGTPVITIGVPGNTSDDVSGNFGPGGMGIAFATGICVGATTGVADADTGAPAANDVIVNIFYK